MRTLSTQVAGAKVQGEPTPGSIGGATPAREQRGAKKAGASRTPADPKDDQAGQRDIGEVAKEISTMNISNEAAEKYGAIAYNGYRAHTNGKSLATGQDIPLWENLAPVIQAAWRAAAIAVMEESDSY